jgi:hypothetical protein
MGLAEGNLRGIVVHGGEVRVEEAKKGQKQIKYKKGILFGEYKFAKHLARVQWSRHANTRLIVPGLRAPESMRESERRPFPHYLHRSFVLRV